jgi:hypothetical protein
MQLFNTKFFMPVNIFEKENTGGSFIRQSIDIFCTFSSAIISYKCKIHINFFLFTHLGSITLTWHKLLRR